MYIRMYVMCVYMYIDNDFIIKKKDHKIFVIEMLCNTLICACVYSGLSPPE